jgi:hypothetical protein
MSWNNNQSGTRSWVTRSLAGSFAERNMNLARDDDALATLQSETSCSGIVGLFAEELTESANRRRLSERQDNHTFQIGVMKEMKTGTFMSGDSVNFCSSVQCCASTNYKCISLAGAAKNDEVLAATDNDQFMLGRKTLAL